MKHSPLIRLDNAKRAYHAAQRECAHWDYESDGDGQHDCCVALAEAKDELRKARAAFKQKEGKPMKCTISHVDTCLSCYVPDHRWIGVPVDGTTTIGEALDALSEEYEINADGTDRDESAMQAAFDLECEAIRAEHGAKPIAAFLDDSFYHEEDNHFADGDSPMVWFTVTFEEDE